MSSPFQTRASVIVLKSADPLKADDPHAGQAGVALSWDEATQKVTVKLDQDGSTWLYDAADLRAL